MSFSVILYNKLLYKIIKLVIAHYKYYVINIKIIKMLVKFSKNIVFTCAFTKVPIVDILDFLSNSIIALSDCK